LDMFSCISSFSFLPSGPHTGGEDGAEGIKSRLARSQHP
jgi:hypothetical protein